MTLKSTATTPPDSTDSLPPALPFQDLLLMVLVIAAGVLLAVNLLPLWLPALSHSVAGSEPKVFWFLSRGSAIVAYWILWLAMGMGVIITNKLAQLWPGIPPAYEIHQYTSLLGMGFALFHALILMGDQYIHYSLVQVLLPFASTSYRPIWVGLGQLAFYIWALVNLSFYVRKRIGKAAWRGIHFASYASFLGALVHGITSGTDMGPLMQALYWFSAASLLFLTVYRVVMYVSLKPSSRHTHPPRPFPAPPG